ncbi:MAG TPA: cation transporter [Deltaproteobacteria bacterium]|nr:cation transporter [Deltaproteobacteria bacterium]
MNPVSRRATLLNIGANAFLFTIKLWVALLSGSIALLSDSFNSLLDTIASIAIFICVKISDKEADEGHPFGHSRAEPIAGIMVAIFAGILGFEIIKTSIERIIVGDHVTVTTAALVVPLVTIVLKGYMAWYFKKVGERVKSPGIIASSVDSLCDVLVSFVVVVGLVGVSWGYEYVDAIVGFVVSIWIIYTGYRIGMENIDYLMGKAPPDELLQQIKSAAVSVKGVLATNTIKAHYVGPFIHVEIHVEVPKDISTYESHRIGNEVEKAIERIDSIEKAFVHIDPV